MKVGKVAHLECWAWLQRNFSLKSDEINAPVSVRPVYLASLDLVARIVLLD